MTEARDLSGRRFGMLFVLARAGHDRHGKARWRCQCACGRFTVSSAGNLLRGGAASCGCVARAKASENATARNLKHGAAVRRDHTPEYSTWSAMHSRCKATSGPHLKYYSGRGISVCERWSGTDGFANFLSDMGSKPTAKHSVDRIDNDRGYEPSNCRWATASEQIANQRHRGGKRTNDIFSEAANAR